MRNYYIERQTLLLFKKEFAENELKRKPATDDNLEEIKLIDEKSQDLLNTIKEIENDINIGLTVSVDGKFRCFDNNEFTLPVRLGDVNYIMGSNGSGKTTILQTIRANKDSLYETNKKEFDGMTSTNIKELKYAPIDISGVDDYFTHVFALDSIEDDPSSFINSATAFGFVNGGGLSATHQSKGQKSKHMLGNLFVKMQKNLGFTINDYKNGKTIENASPLILVDEIDEGFDLTSLFEYNHLLNNLCRVFNATVVCVTHNPFVCYGHPLRGECPVFSIDDFKLTTISEYIEEKTGFEFVVKEKQL